MGTDATRLVDNGDSYVDRASGQDVWTIGNAGIAFTLSLNRDRGLIAQQLISPDIADNWLAGTTDATAQAEVTINGTTRALNGRNFQYEGTDATARGSGVELLVRYRADDVHAEIVRHYACYAGAPVIETWITYTPLDGRTIEVANLSAFDLTVRLGTVRWVTGLQTPAENGGTFTLTTTDLDDGQSMALGSSGRATEQALPWFMIDVDTPDDALFGGILWQGAWALNLSRKGDAIRAAIGMPPFATSSLSPIETPHAYFGVTGGSTTEASEATRAFVMASLRQGRPYAPLVTYNTWFSYGTAVDEESMKAEIESAADLGVELFVLDAGWYPASADPTDYTTGIGVWEADEDRFPSGLAALSDLAHERGMRFGLWVEPERVDIATVGRAGLAKERWLATTNGRYDPSRSNAEAPAAQLCFASPEVRKWVIERLTALIDQVHPDYLKWDNNFWVNCNRSGHSHGAADGNFAHNLGLQSVLGELRARYPDLLIENCSGGGNRIEPGMLAWSDSAWMDDRSEAAPHVRHNLEGLSVVMPPPALLSFVFGGEWHGDGEASDLSLAFRSRMPGMLGATWRGSDLSEADRLGIRREVNIYKELRDTMSDASAQLLTPQVSGEDAGGWDVLQETSAASAGSVLFAFENPGASPRITVRPQGLRPDVLFEIVSVDVGSLGQATGAELAQDGVEIVSSPRTHGHVLELRPISDLAASAQR